MKLDYGTYGMYTMTMPDVKVYIREEDLDKWKSLDKKSEFIHKALNSKTSINFSLDPTAPLSVHDLPVEVHQEMLGGAVSIEQKAARALPAIKKMDKELTLEQKAEFLGKAYADGNKAYKTCKHGADPRFCKFAKPGKPCK